MTTTTKILIGLFVIIFWACSNSTTQTDESTIDKKLADNYVSNISLVDGKFIIDTIAILNNNNLQSLIADLEKTDLAEKNNVAEIPSFIKSFLDSLIDNFSIANPGEEWKVGCTNSFEIDNSTQKKSVDPKTGDTIITCSCKTKDVPSRQLIYFGLGTDIALMTYYTGGWGTIEHVLIFKINNIRIVDFWCGTIRNGLTNKAQIIKYMKENINKEWELNTNIIFL